MITSKTVAKPVSPRLAAFLASRPQDVCLQCRYRAALAIQSRHAVLISPVVTRRYASVSVKDKVLKRLWGRSSQDTSADRKGLTGDESAERETQGNEEEQEAGYEFDKQDAGAGYVEALTTDGLSTIGEITPEIRAKRLGLRDGYRGYMNQEQLKASAIDGAVRQALVEVYTLREAGLPPTLSLSLDDHRGLVAAKSAKIIRDPKGKPQIEWSDKDMRGALVQALTAHHTKPKESEANAEEDTVDMDTLDEATAMAEQRFALEDTSLEQESIQGPNTSEARLQDVRGNRDNSNPIAQHDEISLSPEEAETLLLDGSFSETSTTPLEGNVEIQALRPERSSRARSKEEESWHKICFDNEDIKFSILKRVMQLTGIRVPDPAIQKIDSVALLLAQLHEKPKPKKLAQTLTVNKQLKNLPNVQLLGRRYTPIDREQESGRWKVIVNELRERDLPIKGKKPPSEVEAEALAMPEGWEREELLRQLEP